MSRLSAPFYDTGSRYHHGICSTYLINSKNLDQRFSIEHPGWEICFTDRVSQDLEVRKKEIKLTPGNVAIYNAREEHTEIYRSNKESQFYALLFNPNFIEGILSETNVNPNELLFHDLVYSPSKEFLNLLQNIIELRSSEEPDLLSMECALTHLLLDVLKTFTHSESEKIELYKTSGYFPQKTDEVKKIIWDSFLDPQLNLDCLSRLSICSNEH